MSATDTAARVRYSRLAYVVLAWLFIAALLIQLFLVGAELFKAGPEGLHREWAYIYGWLVPGMLLLGLVGRLAPAILGLTLMLLVLYAVQTVLPGFAEQIPLTGPLHAINALVLFGLAIWLARRATRSLVTEGGPGQ